MFGAGDLGGLRQSQRQSQIRTMNSRSFLEVKTGINPNGTGESWKFVMVPETVAARCIALGRVHKGLKLVLACLTLGIP